MSATILVPYDGSEGAERGLAYAAEIARTQGQKLVLAAAVEWRLFGIQNPLELAESQADVVKDMERIRRDVLDPRCARLVADGIAAEAVVESGPVVSTLIDIAEKHGASQIICGRRGSSKLTRLLMGSVSNGLVQTARCPVTVVP